MAVSIGELEKAIHSLGQSIDLFHKALASEPEEKRAFRDACIQRFEYCIELSWKTSMKLLGSQTAAPKPAIREMARNNLIFNPEAWLGFIDARNKTSHSYDESVAEEVFQSLLLFFQESKVLLEKLNAHASIK